MELMKQAAEITEELSAMVPRWISVFERYPDRELQTVRDAYGMDEVEVIVVIDGANLSTSLFYDGACFADQYGDHYRVVKWMPMPGI